MENRHILKLVEGTFTPHEAGKILFDLLNCKINYHQMELFSNEERFGKDLLNSKKRIEELKMTNSFLRKLIASASEERDLLRINSVIEILILNQE